MRFSTLFIFTTVLMLCKYVNAAELIMFDSSACTFCEQWGKEISAIYPITNEDKKALLRRVFIHDNMPIGLRELKPIIYKPTFILFHENRKLGGISGYTGEDSFWGELRTLYPDCPKI
jgi:thioredoxin-related protein